MKDEGRRQPLGTAREITDGGCKHAPDTASGMGKYDDIIGLPHPESRTRPRMSTSQRAAQFAPFAALAGFEEAIEKVRREMEDGEDTRRG